VDGVHPDTLGHEMLARHLRDVLAIPVDETYDVAAKLKEAGVKPAVADFHGYRQYYFMLPGRTEKVPCIVVAPNQTAKGHPWIWRARFFGHQPELDLSLLDRGFHVAFCDVAHLYGAPTALARWDAFYDFATKTLGLSGKPVLEGMSRGGLPIFLWGERHPDRVAAIYGDNPVCNFRSWPGGKHGQFSKGDWQRCLKAYGITEAQAADFPQPLDPKLLAPLAKAKVPVALVIGTADTVVPPAENGDLLAANYSKLGGPVKVWHKPGKNHHPHGLSPVGPLLRYLLDASGYPVNPAAIPSPSPE
jgi:pimeloyl-ACP methyl ester carboxylesterase